MFAIGDKVLVTKSGNGVIFRTSDLPLKCTIIDNTYIHKDQIHYLVLVTCPKFIKYLNDQGHSATKKYRFPKDFLVKDEICSVCSQDIKLYAGERRLIVSHSVNGFICYGSHRPIDL